MIGSRQQVVYAAKIALAVGLLGLVVAMNRGEILLVLRRRPDPRGFGLAGLLYLSGWLLSSFRWWLLVRAVDLPFRLRDAARLNFIGAFFNFVIPGAVFGNVVKVAFLVRGDPERRPRAIASGVVDFLSGLFGLFVIAAVEGTLAAPRYGVWLRNLVWVVDGATVLTAVGLIVAMRPGRGRSGAFRKHPAVVGLAALLGAGTHVLNVLAFYQVSRAMFAAAVPGLAEHFLLVPLVLFTTAVPLPFGALGVSEQASFALFRLLNYDGGAVAMLGYRLLQLAGAGIGGAAYLMDARQIQHLAHEPPAASEPHHQTSADP